MNATPRHLLSWALILLLAAMFSGCSAKDPPGYICLGTPLYLTETGTIRVTAAEVTEGAIYVTVELSDTELPDATKLSIEKSEIDSPTIPCDEALTIQHNGYDCFQESRNGSVTLVFTHDSLTGSEQLKDYDMYILIEEPKGWGIAHNQGMLLAEP